MRGAPPPPVIRPPNAAADHQFVGAQLYTKAAKVVAYKSVSECNNMDPFLEIRIYDCDSYRNPGKPVKYYSGRPKTSSVLSVGRSRYCRVALDAIKCPVTLCGAFCR